MNYKNIDISKVGMKIRKAREEKGLTQQQLAEECRFAVKTISQIELNKNIPTLINLNIICKALNVRLENILYKGE